MHPEKIHLTIHKKLGIRNGFDCAGPPDFVKHIKKRSKD
jgi:hypothetical protein